MNECSTSVIASVFPVVIFGLASFGLVYPTGPGNRNVNTSLFRTCVRQILELLLLGDMETMLLVITVSVSSIRNTGTVPRERIEPKYQHSVRVCNQL